MIADIATPDERGGFIGIYGGGMFIQQASPEGEVNPYLVRMLAQAVGPVLGGILAKSLGVRYVLPVFVHRRQC